MIRRWCALALAIALLIPLPLHGPSRAQEEDTVARLMASMSGAARVGQLFLVTFPGHEASDTSVIAELIRDYHIGGVLLLPENNNIINEGDTPEQVATLVGQLQTIAWEASRPVSDTETNPFIPLFIAVSQEGNGMPYTAIFNGVTPIPAEMALGATWNPAYAEAVGHIVGQELRAMGINLLLGPSLDVVETPRPHSSGDLGVRVFGGEPFWVGQMGKAYIRGVHTGAEGQVAVIVKHFPGLGTADRSLNEEISTVQRTLDKLRQVDLLPFAAVAQAEDPLARPDGLLVSHIRFRGLEGGRFTTTGPISVDSQALRRLLGLQEFSAWREQGGIVVADSLGLRALRRFYDPKEESFNGRRIAQDALLAGNDVLILSQFALGSGWEERMANVKSTIAFFQGKYEADPSFQALVDAAVARILRLKLALYGGRFLLDSVRPDPDAVSAQVGGHSEVLAAIARDAVTLVSPPSPDLFTAVPTAEDRIVIFTDSREGKPCATCAPVPYIDRLALQNTILRLYGPNATGQVNPSLISSFTFRQLEAYLNMPPPTPTPTPGAGETVTPTLPPAVEVAVNHADWIIFAMLNPVPDQPHSAVLRRFLAERADALRPRPYIVVLACDAPYYLDATEINKLSAYYVAYSRSEPFVEALVRALFNEFVPTGASPVSIPGINYDLLTQVSPDPDQILTLSYEIMESALAEKHTPEPEVTPEPTAAVTPTLEPPRLGVGDGLRLRTSVIVDHNGHPVPDGTPVQFILSYPREGLERSVVALTRGGIAETIVMLDRTGQLDIAIQADPAPRTLVLQITIAEGESAVILTPTPTPLPPTPTPLPTSSPTPEPLPEVKETAVPTPQPLEVDEGKATRARKAGVLDLLSAIVGAGIVAAAGYNLGWTRHRSISQALRLALWCGITGLMMYVLYTSQTPVMARLRGVGVWMAGGMALLGGAVPLILARVTRQRPWPGQFG
ncbi:MAG: hypothetical protein N2508_05560 [Anaerolineae bacterium]|nr:hypothetical protein [Anaerolineae bacterium]